MKVIAQCYFCKSITEIEEQQHDNATELEQVLQKTVEVCCPKCMEEKMKGLVWTNYPPLSEDSNS